MNFSTLFSRIRPLTDTQPLLASSNPPLSSSDFEAFIQLYPLWDKNGLFKKASMDRGGTQNSTLTHPLMPAKNLVSRTTKPMADQRKNALELASYHVAGVLMKE